MYVIVESWQAKTISGNVRTYIVEYYMYDESMKVYTREYFFENMMGQVGETKKGKKKQIYI